MTVTPITAAGPKSGVATQGDAVPSSAPLIPSQMAIIKATVPTLQPHGESVTKVMYNNMLGDAATPEIVDAWTAAYSVLAKILIDRE